MDGSFRDSIPPGAMAEVPKLDRTTAAFLDPDLERIFQREYFELDVRPFARLAVPLAVAGIFSYGIHDYFVVPELLQTALLIRYAFFGPIGVLTILFVLRNRNPKLHQWVLLGFGLGAVTGVIWIASIGGTEAFFLYTGFTTIFVTLGPVIARLNVRMQAVFTFLTIVIYACFESFRGHHDLVYRFSYIMGVATMGSIGVVLARQLEVRARVAFLQRRVIRDQMAELEVERHRSESLLLNVLPRRIAERLKSGDGIIADSFDSATVLFSDIVGFTELSSRLEATEIVKRLDEVFSRFDRIADSLGLEKIKTIGDAYMAVAGLHGEKDHARRAADMALEMVARVGAMTRFDEPLALRVGIHSGPVVAGVIGKKKFIYDVWGDTVNSASRMESHGLPGAIQVSEATYAITKDDFEYEPRGTIKVKGKGEMQTYLLVGRREAVSEGRIAITPSAEA